MDEKIKILIADDDIQIVTLVERFLAVEGFEVLKAFNGPDTIHAVSKERPALLLLDVNMPNASGFQICKTLRKDAQNTALAIVMLTGQSTESDIVEALDSGADDYVGKPFDPKELIKKIKLLLSKAKAGKLPSQEFYKQ